ncbi:MAG: SPOR domain-containing protein [Treponema sp.]|jgi:cell division protein FtsN|nr:SPOR domain-containing protein [Treponema sp.]
MEKKKILFISVIIGLFLFIAIALPLSLLSSKDNTLAVVPPAVAGISKPEEPPADRPASMDVRDAIVNPPEASTGPVTPSGGQNVVINNYDTSGTAVSENRAASNEETVAITVVPATPAAQTPPAQSAAASPPRSGQNAGASRAAQPNQPVNAPKPAAKPAAQSASKPVASAAKPPASTGVYDYWIQTGSFATKPHAENAQKALKERGVSSVIVDAVVKGNKVYRVRTGPYTTFNEASYWLKLIKVIDGLEESWIDPLSK